jgi:hypothetical protein
VVDAHYSWSAFQSLFQLSVALNVGFIALIAFFGNTFEREKRQIEQLTSSSKFVVDEFERRNISSEIQIKDYTKALNLQFELVHEEGNADFIAYVVLRVVAIICAVLALIFLSISSFNSGNEIGYFSRFSSVALLVPVLTFALYSTYHSISAALRYGRKRKEIETSVRKSLLSLTPS